MIMMMMRQRLSCAPCCASIARLIDDLISYLLDVLHWRVRVCVLELELELACGAALCGYKFAVLMIEQEKVLCMNECCLITIERAEASIHHRVLIVSCTRRVRGAARQRSRQSSPTRTRTRADSNTQKHSCAVRTRVRAPMQTAPSRRCTCSSRCQTRTHTGKCRADISRASSLLALFPC